MSRYVTFEGLTEDSNWLAKYVKTQTQQDEDGNAITLLKRNLKDMLVDQSVGALPELANPKRFTLSYQVKLDMSSSSDWAGNAAHPLNGETTLHCRAPGAMEPAERAIWLHSNVPEESTPFGVDSSSLSKARCAGLLTREGWDLAEVASRVRVCRSELRKLLE